jgi:iron complex outermembrane recepter protein
MAYPRTTRVSSCARRTPATLLCSFLLALAAPAAQAQVNAPDADEPVVLDAFTVSGYRVSLEQGLHIKRVNYQMVDAIVAEDIGKFPDNNVVEALQRVSGVQVTNRGGGEVSTVSIRGLNDISTTINGRNIFTTIGRSVALADIPASLLARVDVFKTRAASHLEQGIAGAIDIHTHRPFNFSGQRTVLAARGIYQEQADKLDPNISALFSNRWDLGDGRKFGALVNVSWAETHYRDQSVTAGAMVPFVNATPPVTGAVTWVPYQRIFPTRGGVAENPIWQAGLESGLPFAAGSTLRINGVAVPYLLGRDAVFASDFNGHRERPAANLALQYAPNDTSEYVFEAFYNGYRNDMFNNLHFSFVDWWGGPHGAVELFPNTNIIKSRSSVGFPYGFNSGDLTTQQTDSYLYALGGKWEINDRFTLKSDLSYQTSKFTSSFFAMRTERVAPSIAVDFNAGGGVPAWNFPDNPATANVDESNLADPSLWNIAQLYDNGNRDDGDAATLTLDGDYQLDWSIFNKLQFGLRYDDRGARSGFRTQSSADFPGREVLGVNLSQRPELQYVNKGFFDGRSDVPSSWVVANGYYIAGNADEVRKLYNTTRGTNLLLSDQLQIIQNFDVQEATASGYLQSDFITTVGGRRLDGQIGVRYVSVDTDMKFTNRNTMVTNSASASTDKLLPSLATRYSLTENLRLRASYGQTLRRPGFGQLNPNITYVQDVTNIGYGTAGGGNPNLKPTESKNYDLSIEYYFADSSAVYATWFKREIEGFVVDFRRRVTATVPPLNTPYDYILTQPDNASNGKLDGYEFGLVYFPDVLNGFGVQASYTILDSIQDIPITNSAGQVIGTDTTPLFGVSDKSYSVVLAYEKPRFGVRLSYVWRDDFLNNYEAALFANPLGVYRKPEESLDFQVTYRVTDNLVLTFDATNLTDKLFQSYYEFPDTHNFGSSLFSRTFALGARFSF